MTTRNLDRLFQPRSVALIGASDRQGSVGAVLARNLSSGGFAGSVTMINPHHDTVAGKPCFRDVAALPEAPDLAVIATPPSTVPDLIEAFGARGTRAAVVITAGFSESGQSSGHVLQRGMLNAAQPHLLRIVGPNCLGVLVPGMGLNASFAHIQPLSGHLAFIAQSGAVITSVLDWATPRGIGFSHLVALGDMADVDFGDMLDYLVQDEATRAVLLYVEMITSPRKFMSAARAAARLKPVIVVKAGRHEEGARAAASHTGALAGADLVYDAAFRRAGMLRVHELADLFAAAETLSHGTPIDGDRLAIITNGGGMGVLATDQLIDEGGRLAELAPSTLARLNKILPPTWSHANPVDIIGDADGARYAAGMEVVLDDPGTDAILVLNCPTAVSSSSEAASAIVSRAAARRGRAVLTSWAGEFAAAEARRILTSHGLPTYETPEAAVRAFMQIVTYRRNQRALLEVPSAQGAEFAPDRATVRSLIDATMAKGQDWMSLPAALKCLSAYGIPVVSTRVAKPGDSVSALAATLKPPFALKILSPDILHKSDVGGVVLDLATPEAAGEAAIALLARVTESHPKAWIDGIAVQSMIRKPHGHELLLGLVEDRQFGPVVLFGQGGIATEVVADRAIALPPLNSLLARDLVSRTRIQRLLQGYRGRPAADLEAVASTIVQTSRLAVDHPEVVELDINPLVADERGVVALDARIRVAKPAASGNSRLAIRPYPRELETTAPLRDGGTAMVRPIRPEDAAALRLMFDSSAPGDLYFRPLQTLRELPQHLAARLTQIDYDREMAFGVFLPRLAGQGNSEHSGESTMVGIVHLMMTPDHEKAEFAVNVRSDMKGKGLGYFMMRHIIAYAEKEGVREVYGHVQRDNASMLTMSRELGFEAARERDAGTLIRVFRMLTGAAAG